MIIINNKKQILTCKLYSTLTRRLGFRFKPQQREKEKCISENIMLILWKNEKNVILTFIKGSVREK